MFSVLYFIYGIIIGSFLNVIIYRVPLSLSIIAPRSFCTKCKKNIPFYLNVPIVSYLFLKGRCKYCNDRISEQYPIIEATMGIIFIYAFNNFNIQEALFFCTISSLLVCIAAIDYNHFIIPLNLSTILLIIIIPYIYINNNITYHIFGMMIGFSYLIFIFILTWIFTRQQPMGYGDLILIIILGLLHGPLKILLTIFFAAILGLMYWSILTIIKGHEKNRKLPFGTFLSLTSVLIYLLKINWDFF
tara:strand:+ start:91 stop:825 length:735 start_codon:yes stop_codon:yes gene_type:complete